MRIELQFPFSENYKAGYVNPSSDDRMTLVLVRFDGTMTSTSYARYLKQVELGTFIPNGLEVDHVDNDKMNDDLNNLQLLTKAENIAKDNALRVKLYSFICPACKVSFTLTGKQLGNRNNKNSPACSKKCSYIVRDYM